MKKTDVIMLSELDDYLKMVELRRELVVRLQTYTKDQELQLERLEKIGSVAKSVKVLQDKLKVRETDEDIRKALRKHAPWF